MSDKPQIWDVPISHEERFGLFNIAFGKDSSIESGPDGKKYRRMARAFGLITIRDAVRKSNGNVPTAVVGSTEQRLFKVTAENVEIVLTKYTKSQRSLGAEMVIGELFDRLEVAKDNGQEPADLARREEWLKVEPYDEAADLALWTPPKGDAAAPGSDLTCPSCGQEFTVEEARAGHAAKPPETEPAASPVES